MELVTESFNSSRNRSEATNAIVYCMCFSAVEKERNAAESLAAALPQTIGNKIMREGNGGGELF